MVIHIIMNTYFDDAFYMLVGMDPLVKQSYFHIDRDIELENRVFDELITSQGITDYVFVHEKPELNVRLSREKMEARITNSNRRPQIWYV
jgi:hypothetical protein